MAADGIARLERPHSPLSTYETTERSFRVTCLTRPLWERLR